MNRFIVGACATLLVACSQSEPVAPALRSMPNNFAVRLTTPAPRVGPPDVAAARADEAAALKQIETNLGPESRGPVMAALTGENHDGYHYLVKGKTAEWNDRYTQYYAARTRRLAEERRDASVAAAYRRGGVTVVIALAEPPTGSQAAVLRRQDAGSANVIVLGPNATAETLGGAFAAFDKSRQWYGDDLTQDIMISVQDARAVSVDRDYMARLGQLMDRLRGAPARSIDGVGIVKAISIRSLKLHKPKHP